MKKIWDLVIIGAGPAGLTAGIYAARDDLSTLILEAATPGGLMASTSEIYNYPGFPGGIGGLELTKQMKAQAEEAGTRIHFAAAKSIVTDGAIKKVGLSDGNEVWGRSVLIATGSQPLQLNVSGEAEMYGRGVHFCATCDGALYRDKTIAVIGGGDSAVKEAIFLTKFVKKLYLISLTKLTASAFWQNQLQPLIDKDQVVVRELVQTTTIEHDGQRATGVTFTDLNTDKSETLAVDGIFVFIGSKPNTKFLQKSDIKLSSQGAILVNEHNQTTVSGVFAAGDVVDGVERQIVIAAGDAAKAALAMRSYLDSLDNDTINNKVNKKGA